LTQEIEDKLEREIEARKEPERIERKIARRSEWRVLISRYGLLSYITVELVAVMLACHEVGWDIVSLGDLI
jgi:hypothetical protein